EARVVQAIGCRPRQYKTALDVSKVICYQSRRCGKRSAQIPWRHLAAGAVISQPYNPACDMIVVLARWKPDSSDKKLIQELFICQRRELQSSGQAGGRRRITSPF